MPHTVKNNQPIEKVTELYVAVFPVRVPGENMMAETILAGFQKDLDEPGQIRVRATVETHISAVPDLVGMCDKIIEQQVGIESYRLLKFDKKGIHELNPIDFRENYRHPSFEHYNRSSWGIC